MGQRVEQESLKKHLPQRVEQESRRKHRHLLVEHQHLKKSRHLLLAVPAELLSKNNSGMGGRIYESVFCVSVAYH